MRINVLCIYWFLLCVSIISSCLLFILVASETEKFNSVPNDSNLKDGSNASINISEIEVPDLVNADKVEDNSSVKEADLRSSFEEIKTETQASEANKDAFSFADHLSQNAGVSESYSESNGVLITLVDTATTELKQKVEITLEPTAVEEKNTSKTVAVEVLETLNKTENIEIVKDEGIDITKQEENRSDNVITNKTITIENKQNATEENSKEVHDIPSFSEWTQKQLEEAEKKEKVNTSANSQNPVKNTNNLKLRSKNYASPDCGAKIIATNPEAISPGAVLSSSRDEYKLNACTSRIWFIVELCEAIQAKKIDLANFELFSSSPKDFVVSVSDRFPSRDWSSVGQFTAKDERDIQSFNLHPHLFGKFIKFEMLSHYGSEHFCPISLFRVYGTSEFEVLETEDQVASANDDDDDDLLDTYDGETSNNLFGSARDAVMSIVKKAAEVLVKGGDSNQTEKNQFNSTNYTLLINTCTTPSRIVVCDNCSEVMFGNVYELLSCHNIYLKNLLDVRIINHYLYNTDTCYKYGLNFSSRSYDRVCVKSSTYVRVLFSEKYTAALCNVLAVVENKVVLNTSNNYLNMSSINETVIEEEIVNVETKPVLETLCPMDTIVVKTCADTTTDLKPEITSTVENIESTPEVLDIKPTKTLVEEKLQDPIQVTETTTPNTQSLEPSETVIITTVTSTEKQVANETKTVVKLTTAIVEETTESLETEIGPDQLDKLLSELDQESSNSNAATTVAPPSNVPQQAQKESVFLRLSSRIKALERNMSLSGQYLEELSRRYKKQVEEIQKAFEKKLNSMYDEIKRRDENEAKIQEQLTHLTESLNALLSERENIWREIPKIFGQFVFLVIFVSCVWKYIGSRKVEIPTETNTTQIVVKKRRKSIDTVGHETPVVKKCRRPSEEALKITGTYENLLIQDNDANGLLSKAEKRRRRKRNALLRTQSIIEPKDRRELLVRSSSFDTTIRNKLAPAKIYVNGDINPVKIEEIPFPLEESEHSIVEPLKTYVENQPPNSTLPVKNGTIKTTFRSYYSSPMFMKTALSSRTKRNSTKLSLFKTDKNGKLKEDINGDDSSQRISPDLSLRSNHPSESTDDRSSIGSTSIKKEKKTSSFRRMFKKVFE